MPLRAEELDHLFHVRLAARHFGAAAEAEIEPPGRAVRVEFVGALETGRLAEDAADAAEHRHRRIVRMQRQLDARLLSDRKHGVDEVDVVLPHLLLADDIFLFLQYGDRFFALVRLGDEAANAISPCRLVDFGHIELGATRPTASRRESLGAPDGIRHEVEAEHRDTSFADMLRIVVW